MSIQEDLTLFNTGLNALYDTFEIVLDCADKGIEALSAVKQALCVIAELLKDEKEEVSTLIEIKPLTRVHDALKELPYSVTEQFNGDAYHIIEAHLRTTPEELTLDQLVMLLNMCRIVKNGKEARLTVAQRAEIVSLHPDFQAGATKKAQREVLSEIEKRLEYEHGKYASKAQLVKKKFETDVSYSREWLDKVTGFADAVFEQAPAPAPAPIVEQAPVVEQEVKAKVEYLPDDIPAHYQEIAPAAGEIEAYIDTLTFERVGVDSKGRCWRTPAPAFNIQPVEAPTFNIQPVEAPTPAPRNASALDIFMRK